MASRYLAAKAAQMDHSKVINLFSPHHRRLLHPIEQFVHRPMGYSKANLAQPCCQNL